MLFKSRFNMLRLCVAVICLVVGYIVVREFGLKEYLSGSFILYHTNQLIALHEKHAFLIFILYFAIYAITVSVCLPTNLIMKLVAGFLFGPVFGFLASISSYILGSFVNIILIRHVFASMLKRNFGEMVILMSQKITLNSWTSLVGLRFMPIPFWLYNIIVAFSKVSKKKFIITTLIGATPVSIILAIIGDSIKHMTMNDASDSLEILNSPKFIGSFALLGMLLLIPSLIAVIKRRKISRLKNLLNSNVIDLNNK